MTLTKGLKFGLLSNPQHEFKPYMKTPCYQIKDSVTSVGMSANPAETSLSLEISLLCYRTFPTVLNSSNSFHDRIPNPD